MNQQETMDTALLGALISILFEAMKLIPAKYLQLIFSKDEKTQKLRQKALVFLIILIAVIATELRSNAFSGIDWYSVAYKLVVALISSYTTYKTVVTMVSDKFPKHFTLSQ